MNDFLHVLAGTAPRRRIRINEVVLRDGFQNEPGFVPTEAKVLLANKLSGTGIARLEVTSFVSPAAIPALRDAEEVMKRIRRVKGVVYTVLVPNLRGAERALPCRPDEFNLVMSASETHNIANLRMATDQSFRQLAEVIALASAADIRCAVSLSCSFGCPMDGEIPAARTLAWTRRFSNLGVRQVTYCDTTGMAHPAQVFALCRDHQAQFPAVEATLHLHNTRGLALTNVLAGLAAGVNSYDAALGGIGGCPYAPGATGNVCTEDLVHLLELQGMDTLVDLPALMEISRSLNAVIGHDTPGQVVKAGRSGDHHPVPEWVAEIRQRTLQRGVR